MGYSVKWVVDNLGITRDMLRYYEHEKLLKKCESRNPINNYRDYSDEDIEKIWGIRLLIGIGFSTKEIYAFINDPEFDFDVAIANKVEELERKSAKTKGYLEFAKTIKTVGRVPNVKRVGNMRFGDFLDYAHENWNMYADSKIGSILNVADNLMTKKVDELSKEDIKDLCRLMESFNTEEMVNAFAMHGYYQVISDMKEMKHSSETVQYVVSLLYKYIIDHNNEDEFDGKITPQIFAKYMAPFFISGDISKQHERNYGKDGCKFIARAIAYYGGYDVEDL